MGAGAGRPENITRGGEGGGGVGGGGIALLLWLKPSPYSQMLNKFELFWWFIICLTTFQLHCIGKILLCFNNPELDLFVQIVTKFHKTSSFDYSWGVNMSLITFYRAIQPCHKSL